MLYLIRHPRPDVPEGLCYGQMDVPVAEVELAMVAAELASTLQGLGVTQLWSSPLQRCRLLAERLSGSLKIPVQGDRRLQEIHFGAWEGQRWGDLPRAALDAWAADLLGFTPAGGESVRQLQARVQAWLGTLPANQTIVVVTHAGVIRVLSGLLDDLPVASWSVLPVPYGSLTRLGRKGRIPAHA